MVAMTIRDEINQIVGAVLHPEGVERWWDTCIPALNLATPNELIEDEPERLLEYVKTYLDPSYT